MRVIIACAALCSGCDDSGWMVCYMENYCWHAPRGSVEFMHGNEPTRCETRLRANCLFGTYRASATRSHSAATSSEYPATIPIDNRPPQHLDVATLRHSRMQSMASRKPTSYLLILPQRAGKMVSGRS